MGKKVEKEKNEIVEEFFRRNDPKNIKSMNDMYTAWKISLPLLFNNCWMLKWKHKLVIPKTKEQIIIIIEMDIIQKEL